MTNETTPAPGQPDPVAELAALHGEKHALKAELEGLRSDLELARKEAGEATLRAQADLQNTRRRLERDAENARKFVLEKFAGELLAVVDGLERGLSTLAAGDEALRPAREGMDLTLKLFKDTLRKFEIEEVDPRDQPFDPQWHEAVAQLPRADVAANTVIEVMQKGFRLSGRLLRPAMVVVSRSP